jgi:hypothetical protein
MPATKILWGQILAIFAIVLATTWAATQWTAWRLGYQPQLGDPWSVADAERLRRFLEREVLQWLETRKWKLANGPLIREQAFGEALDPNKLERLGRYEVHLDRKLERMLTMLLRLKELRQGTVTG